MKAIVAVDANWAIGKDNQLLFSLPTDMKHFRSKTLGKVVVMGHSTLRSFPGEKPLPGRTNVVLSRNQELVIPGATICNSLEELTLYLQQFDSEDIMVVGGQTIYQQLLDFCSEIYVTRVHATRPADSYFPNLDQYPNWELAERSPVYREDDEDFTIDTYRNKQVRRLEHVFTPPSLTVRGVTFGTGAPKICIPVINSTVPALVRECEQALIAGADLIEWRADTFAQLEDFSAIDNAIREIRAAIGHLPLLFTVRSQEEGGSATLTPKSYRGVVQAALNTGMIDLLDIEYTMDNPTRDLLLDTATLQDCPVILSYHDISETPSKRFMTLLLEEMELLGADIPKLAVYPRNAKDVITLLAASEEYHRTAKTPFIALSMSWLGSISRLAGEFFGSAITFGSGANTSAPGQLDAVVLRHLLRSLEAPETERFL